MTEFHIIGLGNLCEFVIKNIDEKQTYGTFSACGKHNRKSMQEFVDYVNQLIKENEELKEIVKQLQIDNTVLNKRYGTLISENEDLKTSKEYWREKCLSKDSYNKLYRKAPIWFTQSAKLTDKETGKIAKAIEQDLKQRRPTND